MTEPMPPIEQRTPTEQLEQQQQQQQQQTASGFRDGGNADTDTEINNFDTFVSSQVFLPRITIRYCTQCKWLLRAAYFAQELLSTFNTSLGEVSLIPSTGGVFTVTVFHASSNNLTTQESVIWDRKANGGFPDTKVLKSLVRNIVDPSRQLGHTDRALKKGSESIPETASTSTSASGSKLTSTETASATAVVSDARSRQELPAHSSIPGGDKANSGSSGEKAQYCEECQ